jgi:membrane protein implicated in regulation of membrane protease activity
MLGWLLSDNAVWFSVPAIAGTIYFIAQLAMGQIGGDVDLNMDGTPDATIDDPAGEVRVISLQSLSAFAIGAGWMGLAALRLAGLSFGGATVVALASGFGTAWLLIALLRRLFGLQSSGNVAIQQAVGLTGEIDVAVPPAGTGAGRVRVVVQGRQRDFQAIQRGPELLHDHALVRIVAADPASNTLTVEPA